MHDLTKFLQTLFDGLSVGSFYALIALGYTMVYGILRFINFAHGDVFTLGAWGAFVIAKSAGWAASSAAGADPSAGPPLYAAFVVMACVMGVCAVIGFSIERFAYRPLRSAPRINVLLTAIGVSLLLQNVGQLPFVFGTQPARMPTLLPDRALFTIQGVNFRLVDLLGLAITFALMGTLEWLVFRTSLGRAMRACSHDTRVAALMGINVDRVISITFMIGSALAAAAGFLFSQKYPGLNQPSHTVWVLLGLKAFVAAVVGGIGNIHGAVVGGLLIGLIELFGAAYLSPHLRDVYVFAILIGVLLFRPAGIMGRATIEKV